jgi:hypothetical protein
MRDWPTTGFTKQIILSDHQAFGSALNETRDNGGIAVIGFRSDGTTTLRKNKTEDYSLTVM